MSRLISRLTIGALALALSAGIAAAQTPQAPPAAQPKAPAAAAPKAGEPAKPSAGKKQATTPEGIECSKQADEKKLTGKERAKFRGKCIRDLKKAAKAKAAPAAPAAAPAKKN